MQRFDEIELQSVPLGGEAVADPASDDAPRLRRLLALLTDLSMFTALTLALVPLLPSDPGRWDASLALAGFVLLSSYYYFVGSWLLWGKTVGGAIFDVRIVAGVSDAMSVKAASLRWAGMCASLLTAGIGFLSAALPSRQSLPDRISGTRCIAG